MLPISACLRGPQFFKTVTQPTTLNQLIRAAHFWKPHSAEYIKAQGEAFTKMKIPFTLCKLPQGTELVGLNINQIQPHFFGGSPLCELAALANLSPLKKAEFDKMHEQYFASIRTFTVLAPISCITTSEEGNIIFYVHPSVTKMENKKISLEEINSPTKQEKSRLTP